MSKSLKQHLEEWVITALTAAPGLSGVPIRTVDDDAAATQERLIVSANVAEQQLAGPKSYATDVTVELRSTDRDDAAVDTIFAAVESAMISPGALTDAAARFSRLDFLPENMSSSDDRHGNTRTRSRKYPFEASLN